MIGLSLSLCIRDIIQGNVELDDVEKLIAGTKIEQPIHLEEVCSIYMDLYWDNNPKAIDIVYYLFKHKLIEQPRVTKIQLPPAYKGNWQDDNGYFRFINNEKLYYVEED